MTFAQYKDRKQQVQYGKDDVEPAEGFAEETTIVDVTQQRVEKGKQLVVHSDKCYLWEGLAC